MSLGNGFSISRPFWVLGVGIVREAVRPHALGELDLGLDLLLLVSAWPPPGSRCLHTFMAPANWAVRGLTPGTR